MPTVEMILGLPNLRKGAVLSRARDLDVPVLVSANCFSTWETSAEGLRRWTGFNTKPLANAKGLRAVYLDSAGFVAASLYGGFEWTVDQYINLAASYPFARWFSMDCCVEPEIAANRDVVLDRIASTIRLNVLCRNRAIERGIHHNFAPVIQGWEARDYAACVEGMPWLSDYSLIGVGSMCRRAVHGPNGVLHVLSVLDAILPPNVRLHLFGLKSQAAEAVRQHPRVASVDSQAWGTAARWDALKAGISKTDAFCADTMTDWLARQQERLAKPAFTFQGSLALEPPAPRLSPWDAAIAQAQDELRHLVADGELEYDQITDLYVFELAGEIMSSGTADADRLPLAA